MVSPKSGPPDYSTAHAGLSALRLLQRRFAQRSLTRKTQSAIARHLPALMRLRLERVTISGDGKVETQAWADEVIYFIRNQIQPSLRASERRLLAAEHDRIAWMIADRVEEVAKTSRAFYRVADRDRLSEGVQP